MAAKFALRQAEIAEGARQRAAVVVARQQERRGPSGILLQDRRNILLAKE
jgi:septum formation topological specificity factor MinE